MDKPEPAPPRRGPTVLYLAGIGRSGSTVLGRLLATLPGVRSLGEVVHLWNRGLRDNQLCGCGQPFSLCEFWTLTLDQALHRRFVDDPLMTPAAIVALQDSVDRNRFVPYLMSGRAPASYARARDSYARLMSKVYAAAADVSGAAVLVDTSKNAPYAWLLRSVPGIDLRVVHLVRDPRGVAYSWAKKDRRRPEVTDKVAFMDSLPPWRAALRWSTANGIVDALGVVGTPVLRIRYEDLVACTDRVVSDIAVYAGLPRPSDGPGALGNALDLPREHEVSGNPLRFTDGPVVLRNDNAWTRSLPARDRRIVTALSTPGLIRYGYPLRSGTLRSDAAVGAKSGSSPTDR